jgi:beta-lactamase class A
MGLFGKKDEEYEEDELSPEEELNDRRLTRKFRDLSPENKKKRKEPPKPWGKKERGIVLGFFLFTTISATLMFLLSHNFKLPGLPKIGLNMKSVNLKNPFAEEIIEIGQKKNLPNNDAKAKNAIALFDKEVKPLPGLYGLYVIRLTDRTSYGVSTNAKFQGASLIKLPLMVLMYKMNETGELDLNTKYTLKNSDKVKGSGDLYLAKEGTLYTYRQLAEFMGKNSDRTAYKVMKEIITDAKLKEFIGKIGMENTDIDTGETTPSDIGNLLAGIWDGTLINEDNKKEILGNLTDTIYEKWITVGVPKDVVVAHKFGQDVGVMADGGIVLSKSPYIIVVMGDGITNHDADILFPKISKGIYEIETDNK